MGEPDLGEVMGATEGRLSSRPRLGDWKVAALMLFFYPPVLQHVNDD